MQRGTTYSSVFPVEYPRHDDLFNKPWRDREMRLGWYMRHDKVACCKLVLEAESRLVGRRRILELPLQLENDARPWLRASRACSKVNHTHGVCQVQASRSHVVAFKFIF